MNADERRQLNEAYLQTGYVVETADGEIILRIGEQNGQLDNLLNQVGAKSWAFVTAFNPFSKQLSAAENKARQNELLAVLESGGFEFLHGRGESSGWQPEPSIFIFDIERAEAVEIARQFEQNAIVSGLTGEPAELVWCR